MQENLLKLLERLTAPHPELATPEERQGARLAAVIMLVMTITAVFAFAYFLVADLWDLVDNIEVILGVAFPCYGVAYLLTRTKHYRVGVWLMIGMLIFVGMGAPYISNLDRVILSSLMIPPLFAAIFLSFRSLVYVSLFCTVGTLVASTEYKDITVIVGSIAAAQSVILILFLLFRNALERLRRAELEQALMHAEATSAEAEIAAIEALAAQQEVEEANERIRQASAERETLQQQIIDAQRQNLAELSSPIIPLTEGILLMPLIGNVDSQRAQDIMRGVLAGITRHGARIILLDITGVPMMDTAVAKYLNQTIMAARLKGTRTIVTGVSAAVAETIVDLGIDWTEIETLRDLESGLVAALLESST